MTASTEDSDKIDDRDAFARVGRAGLIAVIRAASPEEAVRAAGALLAGGIPAVELTSARRPPSRRWPRSAGGTATTC